MDILNHFVGIIDITNAIIVIDSSSSIENLKEQLSLDDYPYNQRYFIVYENKFKSIVSHIFQGNFNTLFISSSCNVNDILKNIDTEGKNIICMPFTF